MIRLPSECIPPEYFTIVMSQSGHSQLDAFIHIDASDLQCVYKWRLEQEADLRAMKGSGMTDDQVRRFVDGCRFRRS